VIKSRVISWALNVQMSFMSRGFSSTCEAKKGVSRSFPKDWQSDIFRSQPYGEISLAMTRGYANFPGRNGKIRNGLNLIACAVNCTWNLRIHVWGINITFRQHIDAIVAIPPNDCRLFELVGMRDRYLCTLWTLLSIIL